MYLQNDEVEMFGKIEFNRLKVGYDGMFIIIGDKRYQVQRADANGYHVKEVAQ